VEDRVDVGFRIGVSAAENLIARRLFPLQMIICAAPEYLQKYGAPDKLAELTMHRCSVFRHPASGKILPWRVKVDDQSMDQHVVPALCVNDEALETEAVLAGQVLGSLTGVAAAKHIRAGRLVPLLTEHVEDQSGAFVYYGSRASQPARARLHRPRGGATCRKRRLRPHRQGARRGRGQGTPGAPAALSPP
jgi:DNA-binding transcriptional LysR family regulator